MEWDNNRFWEKGTIFGKNAEHLDNEKLKNENEVVRLFNYYNTL
mgnify:CR=1 FL=1